VVRGRVGPGRHVLVIVPAARGGGGRRVGDLHPQRVVLDGAAGGEGEGVGGPGRGEVAGRPLEDHPLVGAGEAAAGGGVRGLEGGGAVPGQRVAVEGRGHVAVGRGEADGDVGERALRQLAGGGGEEHLPGRAGRGGRIADIGRDDVLVAVGRVVGGVVDPG